MSKRKLQPYGGPRDKLVAFKINKLERDWLSWQAEQEQFKSVSDLIRAVLAGYILQVVGRVDVPTVTSDEALDRRAA